MEVTYKREMKHNYLIVEPQETQIDRYETRMLVSNGIEGLLRLRIKQIDTRSYFYYEITSKQPLSRLLEGRSVGVDDVRLLVLGIARTLDRLEAYLLKEEQIWLEPDFIYVEPDNFSVWLCLIPGRSENFPEYMSRLLQYLLGKVDHQDKECVVLAYGLYQESLKENYGMDDLLHVISGQQSKREEKGKKMQESGGGIEGRELQEDDKAREAGINENGRCAVRGRDQGKSKRSPGSGETGNSMDKAAERSAGIGFGFENDKGIPLRADEHRMDARRAPVCPPDIGKNGDRQTQAGWKARAMAALLIFAVFTGGPVLIWLLKGPGGLREYWMWLAGLDLITLVGALLSGRQKGVEETPLENWQIAFDDEENEDEQETEREAEVRQNAPLEEPNTVLLADLDHPAEGRRLVNRDNQSDDIRIAYFPFIIGKQEGMVDYVLAKNTVSRLHLRFDESDGTYEITDLNSTNGTTVNGRTLEANETVRIRPGDELFIADVKFEFI